jgi:hypothetical protein
MIIAIEGPSAAGKTTWCRSQVPYTCVKEAAENIAAPDLFADPIAVGQFWVGFAVENWRRALAIEREHGVAICDGDPFHLYYSWRSGTPEYCLKHCLKLSRNFIYARSKRSRSDSWTMFSGWKRPSTNYVAVPRPTPHDAEGGTRCIWPSCPG